MDAAKEQVLCSLTEIADGKAKGLLPAHYEDRVFALRRGERVFVYLNSCPHNRRPLEYKQDQFLSPGGDRIICYAHGAHFDVETGHCFQGPCEGRHLLAVSARIENGLVIVPLALPEF